MKASVWTKRPELEVLGHLFQRAAVESQAIIDAIPERIDVAEELDLIGAACVKPQVLAEAIAAFPAHCWADRKVKAMAAAWIDGKFWKTYGKECLNEHRISSNGTIRRRGRHPY